MGRYTYPCENCGQPITVKTALSDSTAIKHKWCASCEEIKNPIDPPKELEEEEQAEKRTKAKR